MSGRGLLSSWPSGFSGSSGPLWVSMVTIPHPIPPLTVSPLRDNRYIFTQGRMTRMLLITARTILIFKITMDIIRTVPNVVRRSRSPLPKYNAAMATVRLIAATMPHFNMLLSSRPVLMISSSSLRSFSIFTEILPVL